MLKIKNLNISFENNNILNNINFEFEKGLNYVILGPSGVGKSTFLNAIAGLVKEYTGDIENSFESISYSFQEGRLIPWLSVEDNLYYILDTRKNILARKILPETCIHFFPFWENLNLQKKLAVIEN